MSGPLTISFLRKNLTGYEHSYKMFIAWLLCANQDDKGSWESCMGKAFTKEEREALQEKLRRTGLKLLAQDGIKNISIRQLTSEAGIAQGGFYTFYRDKDEFVEDLFLLRIREKTDAILDSKEKTLDDPRGFIVSLIYNEGMHLKENKAFVNSESDTVSFFAREGREKGRDLYRSFLNELITFWEENGYLIECDREKLLSVAGAAAILFTNSELIDGDHFKDIYRVFCEAETDRFFRCSKQQ